MCNHVFLLLLLVLLMYKVQVVQIYAPITHGDQNFVFTLVLKMARTKLQQYILATGFIFLVLFIGLLLTGVLRIVRVVEKPVNDDSHILAKIGWTLLKSKFSARTSLRALCALSFYNHEILQASTCNKVSRPISN